MAPKKGSCTATSSSSSRYDVHRFLYANRAIQFEELFAKCNLGSEREIDDKLLDNPVIYLLSRGPWAYLMKFDATEILVDWVREFYNNMDVVSASEVKTYVHGKWLTITSTELTEFLDIPMLAKFDYPISSATLGRIDYDEVATTLCGRETRWIERVLLYGRLTGEYRFLNLFVCHNLEPRGHTSNVSKKNTYLLYAIGTDKRINVPLVILHVMMRLLTAAKNATLPFGVLITQFFMWKGITRTSNDVTKRIRNPINKRTLEQSDAHVYEDDEDEDEEVVPGEQPQGEQPPTDARFVRLDEQMQLLNANIDARFNSVDGRLNAFDGCVNLILVVILSSWKSMTALTFFSCLTAILIT
ncbi:hypothetical protein AAC387_Pa09g1223 [Persea americana]